MSWYKKLMPSRIRTRVGTRKVPEGLWLKCEACENVLYRPELERLLGVCTKCGYHVRLPARQRLKMFLDHGEWLEIGQDIRSRDFLKFKDKKKYRERLIEAQKKTGESDALVVLAGEVLGLPVVAAAFEFGFIGGSMGSVVGERLHNAVAYCYEHRVPFVCFSTSGGARMQEALVSLLQMSKVSAVLTRLRARRLPFVSVLTDPTMGGVTASLAMLGDVVIAEPKARIGFAGARVIEQTTGVVLPEGFQRSEFLLSHGAIDMILPRTELRPRVANILRILGRY